ncbi:MAG: calcium-binding protein [Cyanobacteriota bacterium]
MSASITTTANIEKFIFTGTNDIDLTANDLDNTITANSGVNIIYGGGGNDAIYTYDGSDTIYGEAGNDVLDGGTGADQLYGGLGNDTYYVDNAGDSVIENADEGYDTVRMSASITTTANIEKFIFTGTNDIDLTANDLDNTITANSGVNVIYGGGGNDAIYTYAGNDTIFGDAGNDVLDGGTEADQLYGGLGNDTYYVDNTGDSVFENADEGYDTVRMSASFISGDNIEKFIFTGSDDIDLTANDLDNIITANNGANIINSGGGNDIVYAYDGDDEIYSGSGNDLLYGYSGNDTYYFNTGDNVDTINDQDSTPGNFDTTKLGENITKNDVAIFMNRNESTGELIGDLTIDYGNGDVINVKNQALSDYGIENLELSDVYNSYMHEIDINQVIQDMYTFANGDPSVDLTGIEDVKNNPDLMNIVIQGWNT